MPSSKIRAKSKSVERSPCRPDSNSGCNSGCNNDDHTFSNRAVKDLAWALLSPALFLSIPDFSSEWFKQDYIDDDIWPWLKEQDRNSQCLHAHLVEQRSTRLGIYFEQLLSFYFEYFPRFTLLAKNLQVNGQQRTLGEFDFIIHDKRDNKVKHIEAAVKFYLGHDNYRGKINNNISRYNWHDWVGPNQKDTLAIKMRHLQEHQLPLIKTEEGIKALNSLILKNEIITSRLLIRGRFYLPFYERFNTYKKVSTPHHSNTALEKHYWLDTVTLFDTGFSLEKNYHYCILPRSTWLSEINHKDLEMSEIEVVSDKKVVKIIQEGINQNLNEWQIAKLDLSNKNTVEMERFFVVNSQNLPSDK